MLKRQPITNTPPLHYRKWCTTAIYNHSICLSTKTTTLKTYNNNNKPCSLTSFIEAGFLLKPNSPATFFWTDKVSREGRGGQGVKVYIYNLYEQYVHRISFLRRLQMYDISNNSLRNKFSRALFHYFFLFFFWLFCKCGCWSLRLFFFFIFL